MIERIKATRVLAVLLVAVLVTSVLPMMVPRTEVTENASAAGPYYVKLAMTQDFQNWNPLNIELVSDYVGCYLMFSVLFQYTEDWAGPVNDLATGYYQTTNPVRGNMSTFINITQNAYFRNLANPTDTSHKLTATDVEFTIELILAHPGGAWDSYLKDITGVNATSQFQVQIDTSFPKATLIDNLVWIPILPKYIWQSVPSGQVLTNKVPSSLVGSGPFMFNSSMTGSWYRFDKAPNYHGSTDYPSSRVVTIDGLVYSIYTDASAMVLDMNGGQLDAIDLSGSPNLFLGSLGQGNSHIIKMVTQENGMIDVAINAIPMDFRAGPYGKGNPLLLDPYVRQAILMTMNRTRIVNTLLDGLPTPADSVLAPGYWHKNITVQPFNTANARSLLLAHGYIDSNSDGILEATASAYPVVQGWARTGDPLSFRLRVPDTDPTYDIIARDWPTWTAQAGIQFNYGGPTPEKTMIFNDWYLCDYDIWVWAWYWSPEPLNNLGVWNTDQIKKGGDNCQMPMGPWWYSTSNSTLPSGEAWSAFDENYTAAKKEFDPAARKIIVDNLQQMIYDSFTETPPIYPAGLWAVSDQRFTGWGNWTQHIGRSFESDLLWTWFDLQPTGANMPPEYDNTLQQYYEIVLGDSQTFTVTAHDPEGDPLAVTWDFGDGQTATNSSSTGTGSPTTFTKTHTYTALALPPIGLDMTVNVSDGNTGNYAISRATVYVIPAPDTVPQLSFPILSDPIDRAYVNEMVTWTAGAKDAESGGSAGYGLEFTWVWGDGVVNVTHYQPTENGTEVLDTVMHSWSIPSSGGTYDVELFVWDGSLLPGHNVSLGVIPFEVIENQPPAVPNISSITANRNTAVNCLASSSDTDGDIVRFTWHWDDGTYSVTEAQAGADEMVVSMVNHTWGTAGSYLVEVFADDLTGIAGHNVSASITAVISNIGANVAPCALGLIPVPGFAIPGETVTFNASAVDTNSDALTMYLIFGDGNSSTKTTPGGATTRQSTDFTHAYADAGVYLAELWVDDANGHNVTVNATVTVTENSPPWLILSSGASAYYNRDFVLTPARVRDNDSDTLTVWYDWGDSNWTMGVGAPTYAGNHTYMSMGNKTVTVYVDDGTGLADHNVSKTIEISMNENLRPQFVGAIEVSPVMAVYQPGDTVTFDITVKDYEGDMLNITVDFGDGSAVVHVPMFKPLANANETKSVSHIFENGSDTPYTVTITVDDGQLAYHSIKTWNTATVSIEVEKKGGGGISSGLMIGIGVAVIVIVALLLLFLLMKRKKEPGEKAPKEVGGMEGMAPPPETPKKG
jgi:peptide/nickel transport system substrate-binding protein